MLKVGEGTSSVLSIVLGDESLSIGLILDGYVNILPHRKDAAKVSAPFAFTENGDAFIDEATVALNFRQLVEDVSRSEERRVGKEC